MVEDHAGDSPVLLVVGRVEVPAHRHTSAIRFFM
jgi:hypothetical protein